MKNETKRLSLAASIVASSVVLASPAFAEGEVVFSSWGGSFQDALRSAMLEPAASALNVTVKEDTTNGFVGFVGLTRFGDLAIAMTQHHHPFLIRQGCGLASMRSG